MNRLQKNMLATAAVVVLGGVGGVIALRENKTPSERFLEQQNQKRLFLGFGLNDVIAGELVARSATIAFSRDPQGEWRIERPIEWPGDPEALDAAVNRMVGLILESKLEKADIPTVGLDKPRVKLKLKLKDGKTHQLLVGPRNELVNRYPVTDGEQVGLAEPSFFWSVDRPVDDFRSKRLFSFSPSEVKELRVEKGGAPRYLLERKDEGWMVSDPSEKGKEPGLADGGRINLLLVALLRRLKIERFLTDDYDPGRAEQKKQFGLDKPAFTVELKTKDKVYTAELGGLRETAAEEPLRVIHLVGSPTVVEVPSWIDKDLDVSTADLRDKTISRFDRHAVKKVKMMVASTKTIVIERSEDGRDWKLTAPVEAPAKPWKVDDLVRVFSGLKATEVHKRDPSAKELFDWLLKPASRQLQFYDKDGKLLGDVSIGNYVTEEELFVMATGSDRVDRLSQKKLVILPKNHEDLIDKERN